MSEHTSAWLVDGDDPSLVADEVRRLVAELAGADAGLSVEDFWGDEVDLDGVTGACLTPPFLADRRVVVLRDAGRFSTEDLGPLLAYLDDPLPTTALIVAGGGGRLAPKLVAAVKKVGRVISVGPGRDTKGWLEARLRGAPLQFEPAVRPRLADHLGEELGRLPALVETLVAAYGEGARIGVDELEPFLGEAGGVAPWDLTDAIDRGDPGAALTTLHRLLGAGDRHPLVVLAILHRHVAPILQLDGSGATGEAQAAAVLGLPKGRSRYPAKKALATLRRWGSDGVARAIHLLADADVDLRGESTWPPEAVLEVLVARLSRLGPGGSRRAASVASSARTGAR
ncbi:MAG TPA: DNA polymerase III subunit delta [Acidimicrobiales bacterium]|nr:DNA polymerase III subunit delta [Acidimicrobiales bacterium]